jgi:hypothetical protein
MTTINVADYWPHPPAGKTLTNTFDAGLVLAYSQVANTPGKAGPGVKLHQTQNGVWRNDWFMRYDPVRGVLEYEDDYPVVLWQPWNPGWPNVKAAVMAPGHEIIWGGAEAVGSILQGQCEIKFPQLYGWQRVVFNSLHSFTCPAGTFNVLDLTYYQSWSNTSTIVGANMYFALGLGQIYTAWLSGVMGAVNPTGYSMTLQSSVLA